MTMVGNVLILLAGLLVYGSFGLFGLCCLLAATALSYGAGLLIPRHRWVMWVSVGISALLLIFVKIQPLTGMELLSVMGISYFTLRIISYQVDLYRGAYEPEKNILRYGLYVTYLPQLFLGPLERYDQFAASVRSRRIGWDGISCGGARVLWGLFKKLIIAARAGVVVSAISAAPEEYRGAYALAAMVLYYLQLYADFSGGVDIIIGVSQILGIRVSENFRTPYLAESVQEFWKRWHITLGSWLRDYVYIPLGGSRKGKLRRVVNTIVTFLVSGLWHGVHYLLWGVLNGLFVLAGSRFRTKHAWLNRLGTFFVITFLWAFFVWPDTGTALEMMASVFTTFHYGAFLGGIGTLGLGWGEWCVLFAGTAGLLLLDTRMESVGAAYRRLTAAGRTVALCLLGLTILVFGMYGIGFEVEAFIYSKF